MHGRDEDMENIVKSLLSDDVPTSTTNGVRVIPILGRTGIWKSALARLVNNDVRVKNHCGLKAWVYVSKFFDIFEITKTIYESVTKTKL